MCRVVDVKVRWVVRPRGAPGAESRWRVLLLGPSHAESHPFKKSFSFYDACRMQRSRRFATSATACFVLAGCTSVTSSVADNGDAAIILRTAADKTLAVESFHAQATLQMPSGSGPGTVDYQAPDREHLRWGTGKEVNETISIGDTVYLSALGRPGHFWRIDGHGRGAADVLMYLRYLDHADNVRLDGHLYRFDLRPSPAGPGKARRAASRR